MITTLRAFVDRTTMYRLVLYYLLLLFGAAMLFGALGLLPYNPFALALSAATLLAAAWIANEAIARYLRVTANHESVLITALILALILPPAALGDVSALGALAVIAVWAVASKYLVSIGNKHIFNPAALAVALSSLLLGIPATWWVAGNLILLPLVILGGLLVVWKIRRWDLVLAFFAAALTMTALTSLAPLTALQAMVLHSALFFLAFAMLTEPLTMPPTRALRICYGALVGIFFAPAAHIGSFFFTPELALILGNAYAFIVGPKGRYRFMLITKRKLSESIYEFAFASDRPLRFEAGQYLEWTVPSVPFDSRGNRRYFTIASAPENEQVAVGMRFYAAPSAAKRTLAALPAGAVIFAGALAGDFTLPKNMQRKLAFIAGGVGVTPFVSMARHLTASGEHRDAVLLYSARTAADVAYQAELARAQASGLHTYYALTDRDGAIDAAMIARTIPDYRERLFYISGPPAMVSAMKRALRTLGVSRFSIKTDYFPGLA